MSVRQSVTHGSKHRRPSYRDANGASSCPAGLVYPSLHVLKSVLKVFLDASSHLYKRVCLSVGPLVPPSVGPLCVFKRRRKWLGATIIITVITVVITVVINNYHRPLQTIRRCVDISNFLKCLKRKLENPISSP